MTNNLIIASSRQDRLASWKQALGGFVSTTFVIDSLSTLRDDIVRIKPGVLLLDYDLLGSNSVAGLRRICTATRTIIIGDDISEEMECELLKAGVRGCCRSNLKPQFLGHVVDAVQQGVRITMNTFTHSVSKGGLSVI